MMYVYLFIIVYNNPQFFFFKLNKSIWNIRSRFYFKDNTSSKYFFDIFFNWFLLFYIQTIFIYLSNLGDVSAAWGKPFLHSDSSKQFVQAIRHCDLKLQFVIVISEGISSEQFQGNFCQFLEEFGRVLYRKLDPSNLRQKMLRINCFQL